MYESNKIAEVIKVISKQKGIQLKTLLFELHLNKNTFSHMYNGSMIAADSLARIADYLGCSVDYLLGREEHSSSISTSFQPALDEHQQKLLDDYNKLNNAAQKSLLSYADFMTTQSDNLKDTSDTSQMIS